MESNCLDTHFDTKWYGIGTPVGKVFCMFEVSVRTLIGSDENLKIGIGCSFSKHSAFRNKSHWFFGRDLIRCGTLKNPSLYIEPRQYKGEALCQFNFSWWRLDISGIFLT